MYKTNDYVVHSVKGLCIVEGKSFPDGIDYECYVISPVTTPNLQMYVPVENTSSLRKVMTAEEANSVIDKLPHCNVETTPGSRIKSNDYKKMLNSPTAETLSAMVKILYKRQLRKERNTTDNRILKMAETLLLSELALALDTEQEEVKERIIAKL